MKKLLILLAVTVVALCVVSTAAADKRTLSITPTPVFVGDAIVFAGCGYTPGDFIEAQAVLNTKPATYIVQISETADASGCFSTADFPYVVPAAGKWAADAFDNGRHAAGFNFIVS